MLSSFRAILGAGVCLLPLTAFAQTDTGFDVDEKPAATAVVPPSNNWVTLGGQYNSSRSYYLGRYNGVVDPGFSGIAGLHFSDRDAWDSGGTHYTEFTGENLGRTDRSLAIRLGEQGTWGLSFTYDGIPYYAANSFKSVFDMVGGVGTPRSIIGLSWTGATQLPTPSPLVTPFGTTPTVTPAYMPKGSVVPNMQNYKLSTQRDIFTLGGKYQWDQWTISSGWRHEHKGGWQANSYELGGAASPVTAGTGSSASPKAPTSAISSGMAYFAQPIDYDMDRFDISGLYNTQKFQAQLSYTFSQFQNNVGVINLMNPWGFAGASGGNLTTFGPTTASAANAGALYGTPPNNAAHQWKAMFGYNILPQTRLNVNLGYGLQMQDQSFVQGSGNTNAGAASAITPNQSFQGLIQTLYGNVALTTHPLQRMDIRIAYTIDERDNQSPRNAYSNISQNSAYAANEPTYYNSPYSVQHQTAVAEVGYRLAPQTKVTLSQTLDDMRRNYSNTPDVLTERTAVKLRGPVLDELFGSISASHEQRWASNYTPYGWWTAACGGPTSCKNVELGSLVMYSEASRQRNDVKGTLDFTPTDSISISLFGKGAKDTYPANKSGLRSNYNVSVGPDVSWRVSKTLTAHAFYTYQQIFYNQSSYYQSPGLSIPNVVPTPTAGSNTYAVWYNTQTTDAVQTFGVNVDWQAIPEVLKLSFDGNFSYGDTAYALGDGMSVFGGNITSATTVANFTMKPLPNVESTLITVGVHGEYDFRPNITLLFGYSWEKFNYKDFMVGTSSTQYANILLPGTLAPNDSIHTVSAALRMRF
jgi:MtrB/PioB family decaheme-associated outer membrane protein